MQKTSRFIRRNAVDRIFVILPVLLLVALLARGITGYLFPVDADKCVAEISFVVRAVDAETKNKLEMDNPTYNFSIAGDELLCNARITDITQTKEVVSDGEGNLIEIPTDGRYDVTFTVFYADGASVVSLAESGVVTLYAQWKSTTTETTTVDTTTETTTVDTTTVEDPSDDEGFPVVGTVIGIAVVAAVAGVVAFLVIKKKKA